MSQDFNIISTSIGYIAAVLVSMHRNDLVFRLNTANKILTLVCVCVLIFWGFNLEVILLAYIAINLGMYCCAFWAIKMLLPELKIKFSKRFSLKLIFISFPLILAAAAEFVSLRIDTIFIANMTNEKIVGFYSAACNILMGAVILPLALTKVYFPNFVKISSHSDKRAFLFFWKYFKLIFCYSALVGLFFYFFSEHIILLVYGESFSEATVLLQLFAFALIAMSLNRFCNYTLLALKRNSYYFQITLLGMVINLALNYILISSTGALGAAISTIVTEFTALALGLHKLLNIESGAKN